MGISYKQYKQYDGLNDYSLITKIKSNKIPPEVLYYRYFRLITKVANTLHIKKSFECQEEIKRSTEDIEDFCQDAYIPFLKALDKVDLSLIENPETWEFVSFFWYQLRNLRRNKSRQYDLHKRVKKSRRDNKEKVTQREKELISYLVESVYPTSVDSFESEVVSSIDNSSFFSSLEPIVYKILKLREQGYTYHEIADKLNKNYSYVYLTVKNAKEKYLKLLG